MPTIFLLPSFLAENANQTIPPYVLEAALQCKVFFVENERSARRYLKALSREFVIDNYEWVTIHKAEAETRAKFIECIKLDKNIGIISEAGSPGVADPGQILTGIAHEHGAIVKPLVGPSSILLALMGSGMNGQQFQFLGYLPIDAAARTKSIRDLESESSKKNCTQIFIETPYRNDQLLDTLLKTCKPTTRICVAADITDTNEFIKTMTVADWKRNLPALHKRPVIFCVLATS